MKIISGVIKVALILCVDSSNEMIVQERGQLVYDDHRMSLIQTTDGRLVVMNNLQCYTPDNILSTQRLKTNKDGTATTTTFSTKGVHETP